MPRLLLATAFAVASLFSLVLHLSTVLAQTNDDFAFGVIVDSTDPRSMARAREAGFTHAKMMTFWDRLEPGPGDFYWNRTDQNDLDNILRGAPHTLSPESENVMAAAGNVLIQPNNIYSQLANGELPFPSITLYGRVGGLCWKTPSKSEMNSRLRLTSTSSTSSQSPIVLRCVPGRTQSPRMAISLTRAVAEQTMSAS